MADEIKTRVTIEADEALRLLKDLTGKEYELTKATEEAGKKARQAGEQAKEGSNGWTRMKDAIAGVTTRLSGWIAVAAVAGSIMKDMASKAREAASEYAKLGEAMGKLSVQVGGQKASAINSTVLSTAAQNRLGVAGRTQASEFAMALTDQQSDMPIEQIQENIKDFGVLYRATGVGGRDAFRLTSTMQSKMGLTAKQSYDTAATMLANGWGADELVGIMQKTGSRGGIDLLAALRSGQQAGLDMDTMRRQIVPMLDTFYKQDETGQRLDVNLMRAGITDDMTTTERMRQLYQYSKTQPGGQQMAAKILGGSANISAFNTIAEQINQSNYLNAQRELLSPGASQELVNRKLESPEYRAYERQLGRDLMVQVQKEQQNRLGEIQAQQEAESYDNSTMRYWKVPDRVPLIGGFGINTVTRYGMYALGYGTEADQERNAQFNAQQITVIGTNYNQGNPFTEVKPIERP